MEAMVYRKSAASSWTEELDARSTPDDRSSASVPASAPETSPLSPELFYPLVTEQERVTWTHWLPTSVVFDRTRRRHAPVGGARWMRLGALTPWRPV